MGLLLELVPILPANSCSFYKAQLQCPLQVFLGLPSPHFPLAQPRYPREEGTVSGCFHQSLLRKQNWAFLIIGINLCKAL